MGKIISVFYTSSSKRDLTKINQKDAKTIVLTIKKYTDVKPLEKAKALKGVLHGMYRYRIGNYRAIFEYSDKGKLIIVTILTIKHRKDIYKN